MLKPKPRRATRNTFENEISEIRDYARLLRTGVTSVNRLNVYFCGEPEAGKTTLSRSLVHGSVVLPGETSSLKMRTRGIDVAQVKLPSGTDCCLWDFAGQSDYHVHHDLFVIHGAAVFVLLVDARRSTAERKAHATYWLQYIVTQCPPGVRPSVLMLASHVDEAAAVKAEEYDTETQFALLFMELSAIFGSAVQFVGTGFTAIDCRDGDSSACNLVRSALDGALEQYQEVNGDTAPAICKQMVDALVPLRERRTHFLTWPQYTEIMSGASRDKSLLKIATRHLHKIGEVYYSSRGTLADIVIIDLPWLCHEVLGWVFCPVEMLQAHEKSRLIRFRQLAEQGPVDEADIPITNQFEGTRVETLDVLEAFELCTSFAQETKKMYVFPSLLRTAPRGDVWQPSALFDVHIGLRFSCSSMTTMIPPGFFQRLQISAQLAIGSPQAGGVMWQNGIVCSQGGTECRLALSQDGRAIYLHVRGKSDRKRDCRRLTQTIIGLIERSVNNSPGLVFAVDHCDSVEVSRYVSEPYAILQKVVLEARVKGRRIAVNTLGRGDIVAHLLGMEPQSKYILR